MKITITGGLGFIGNYFAKEFLKEGHTVQIIDNFSRAGSEINFNALLKVSDSKQLKVIRFDISRDPSTLINLLEGQDTVIHLASQVAVTKSILNPRYDFESNVLGTFNILEAIRKCQDKPSILYASTNKVYGSLNKISTVENKERYDFVDLPRGVDENCLLDFHSPYGCSKGSAEQYILDYSRTYHIKSAVFRQSCIYGPGQFGIEDQGWAAWMTIASVLNKEITLFGNGKQVRDLLHVKDLFKAYQSALSKIESISGEVFNVGGGIDNSRSLIEFIRDLKATGKKEVNYKFSDWRMGDQKIFISDNSKAFKLLGWKPEIKFQEGLGDLLTWTNDNIEIIKNLI